MNKTLKAGEKLTPAHGDLFYNSPVAIRAFLDERGFSAQKRFGQNFLINPNARAKMLAALDAKSGDNVWEVGPGLGAMTSALLAGGAQVRAFEIDKGFCAILREFFGTDGRFSLEEGNVLDRWQACGNASGLCGNASGLCGNAGLFLGNLPFNIAGLLLGSFVEGGLLFRRMALTVQKEVAARVSAKPGQDGYSSLSVLHSLFYKVTPLAALKPAAFYPAPHVDSAALVLDRLPDTARPAPPPVFYPLLRALFASRRKTVRNNLKAFMGNDASYKLADAATPESLLSNANIDGSKRAQQLLPADFLRLAAYAQGCC
jgi:16S rRNA (adenine1518-N6/adenine1519-N6)-dimethyltransferase